MDENTHYVWQPEGSDRAVKLSFEVLDEILNDVLRGFGAVPRRGAEVGGILLGRTAGTSIEIDGFDAVPCDYRLGPSYHFTETDDQRFDAAVARHAEGHGLAPVGFYRSDTRQDLALDEEDRKLMERWFPDPSAVVLLIRPYATKVSRAGFFYRTEGAFPGETPLDFPFSRKLLGGGARPRSPEVDERPDGGGQPDPLSKLAVVPPRQSGTPPGEHSPQRAAPVPVAKKDRAAWASAVALSVALGWGGGYFTASKSLTRPDPAAYRLGFTVSPRLNDLSLVWDGASPAIQTATGGQLHIREGGQSKTVPLDLEQLRGGTVVYRNVSGSVHFELEVEQASGATVREVREFMQPRASTGFP